MPIVITARHRCEKCSRVFEWNHPETSREKRSLPLYVPIDIPEKTLCAHSCKINDKGSYNVQVNCPHCGYDNWFEYAPDEK